MRSVRSAICTSGEPVSVSCSRYSAIVAGLSGMYEEPRESWLAAGVRRGTGRRPCPERRRGDGRRPMPRSAA